ncbi:AMP-binding protein [Rhodococcus opacus]|uniref:AMP-binding protein n=1 Tax=Rhodococcus opacus TaxID=37919 RepID=A0AAX3YSE5_RHOOP|nr:AMP-binding protein [Rhodococcus opacus]MCZ4585966.1 AMP-binding protein [Rhodococcus opacus]WLF52078.1 AMP-binding protein [Rhodococcus opacus]
MEVPLTVKAFLDRGARIYGDRVAIVDEPDLAHSWGRVTYRDLARRAAAQAAYLDRMEVPHGARVAVMSQNSARLLTSFFGVSGWGRVLVPVNFRLTVPEVQHIVDHSGADVLLVDPELTPVAWEIRGPRVLVIGESDEEMWTSGAAPVVPRIAESDTATLNYTSGTTARPKGVQLTHRNLWLNAVTFGWHLGVDDEDVYLHTLPMFHVNGWGMPYAVTGAGGTHVVLRKVDGPEILRRVHEHGVTVLCAAPAVLHSILDAAANWEGEVPGRDRVRVVVAGAPPPTRTVERIRSELGWEFIQIYGMTESAPLITMSRMRREWRDLPSSEQARLLARAGAPTIGVDIEVDGHGEVLVRSNHNLAGYWRNPEDTETVLRDGWLHTGDGGYLSDDGYLTIIDRKKDVIVSGGENVSSIEVEDVLIAHPGVREVAVIGIPDEKWGEAITALVVPAVDDLTAEQLIAHCRGRLAGYKCPKHVEFRTRLERTETGKLQKFKLRQPYWEGRERSVN